MIISDAELDRMQAVGDAHLAGTAIIQRATATSDAGGGGSVVWANVGTVSARFAPASTATEELTGERMGPEVDSVVTLPAFTDVRAEDRIVTASRTLAVTNVQTPLTWEVNRRVETTELT